MTKSKVRKQQCAKNVLKTKETNLQDTIVDLKAN